MAAPLDLFEEFSTSLPADFEKTRKKFYRKNGRLKGKKQLEKELHKLLHKRMRKTEVLQEKLCKK